jgi:hypothetical protein
VLEVRLPPCARGSIEEIIPTPRAGATAHHAEEGTKLELLAPRQRPNLRVTVDARVDLLEGLDVVGAAPPANGAPAV